MNQKNKILFVASLLSFLILCYSYFVSNLGYVNWIDCICFWLFIFSSITLMARLLFNIRPNFYLVVGSLAFAILWSEFNLRAFDVGSFYIEKRNKFYVSAYKAEERNWLHVKIPDHDYKLQNIEYNYPRHTNSLGLSDVEFQKNKRPNSLHIFCIGDSFTEGDGSPSDSTWPKRMQENLRKNYAGLTLDIYNAGACGSDPFFGYQLLRQKLLNYKPDLVIMTLNNSDIDDYMIRGGMERFAADTTTHYNPHPWYEFFMAVSYVNRLVLNKVLRVDYNLMTSEKRKEILPCAISGLSSIIKTTDSLCRSHGCTFMVFYHPDKFEYKNKAYYAINPIIAELNKNSSIHSFDFLDFLLHDPAITKENIDEYYWHIDGHHNPKGYMLMGDAITPKVISILQPQLDSLHSLASKGN